MLYLLILLLPLLFECFRLISTCIVDIGTGVVDICEKLLLSLFDSYTVLGCFLIVALGVSSASDIERFLA